MDGLEQESSGYAPICNGDRPGMNQRVRCPHCHRWTDALLVWAAGDCCPSCNTQIMGFDSDRERADEERVLHGSGRILGSRADRTNRDRLSERA